MFTSIRKRRCLPSRPAPASGISALYRRYASKEDLLREVARDGLQQYLDEAEAAVADERDPWTAFATFMERLLDAQTVAITMSLAGAFTPSQELIDMSIRAASSTSGSSTGRRRGRASGRTWWSTTCR